ncbi:MAG: DUF86 domain-containing protein [Bacteroidetes bacterium]|nr:DUF86 domain-containing protein [Bacteroidota bacterium]
MQIEVSVWLVDIQRSIDEIFYFLGDKRDFFAYQKDLKTKKAVERNLEIIGEAVNRIMQAKTDVVIANHRRIVDTRNRIIHGYDNVSDEVIWTIIIRDLPELRKEVEVWLTSK